MIVWITGEKDKAEEKRLAEAIAGAFVKGVVLHGEEFIEEFKLPGVEGKFNSKIASRLIITAKILIEGILFFINFAFLRLYIFTKK